MSSRHHRRIAFFIVSAAVLLVFGRQASSFAQQQPSQRQLSSPRPGGAEISWSEFPSVARVYQLTRGKDAADTASKVAGAFKLLEQVVEALAHKSEFELDSMPPPAAELWRQYRKARNDMPIELKNELGFGDEDRYLLSPQGRRDILAPLLSPAIDAAYNPADTARRDAHTAKARAENEATQEQEARIQGKAPYRRTSERVLLERATRDVKARRDARQEAEAWKARAEVDLAMAGKARVGVNVFGLPLGRPLDLPDCSSVSQTQTGLLGQEIVVTKTCFLSPSDAQKLCDASAAPVACGSNDSWLLRWSQSSLPGWAKGAQATLKGDMLVAVEIRFSSYPVPATANAFSAPIVQAGVDFAAAACRANVDQAQKELRAKYGKPTKRSKRTFVEGAIIVRQVEEMEWALPKDRPGLYVKYRAGTYEDTVTIELASVHDAADQSERKRKETAPSL